MKDLTIQATCAICAAFIVNLGIFVQQKDMYSYAQSNYVTKDTFSLLCKKIDRIEENVNQILKFEMEKNNHE